MNHCHAPILTRLILDTVACLRAAQDDLHDDVKTRAGYAIRSLSAADVTNADKTRWLLCEMGRHLREVEQEFRALDRPFSANKVHGVLERVEGAQRWTSSVSMH